MDGALLTVRCQCDSNARLRGAKKYIKRWTQSPVGRPYAAHPGTCLSQRESDGNGGSTISGVFLSPSLFGPPHRAGVCAVPRASVLFCFDLTCCDRSNPACLVFFFLFFLVWLLPLFYAFFVGRSRHTCNTPHLSAEHAMYVRTDMRAESKSPQGKHNARVRLAVARRWQHPQNNNTTTTQQQIFSRPVPSVPSRSLVLPRAQHQWGLARAEQVHRESGRERAGAIE